MLDTSFLHIATKHSAALLGNVRQEGEVTNPGGQPFRALVLDPHLIALKAGKEG